MWSMNPARLAPTGPLAPLAQQVKRVIEGPDRFRITVRGGLAVGKTSVVHEGEFTLDHDHLSSHEAGSERVGTALAQRLGQRGCAACGVARQPRRQALGVIDQLQEGDDLRLVVQAGARIALPQPGRPRASSCARGTSIDWSAVPWMTMAGQVISESRSEMSSRSSPE